MTTRIIVTGSRDWADEEAVKQELFGLDLRDVLIIHGDCPTGADAIAEKLWKGAGGKTEKHPAQWDLYGKSAGPRRNREMAEAGAEICLAFTLPGSRGTLGMMKEARNAGIPVKEIRGEVKPDCSEMEQSMLEAPPED